MNNIETMIEAAWQKARGEDSFDPDYPVKASENFAQGFLAGVQWAMEWCSPFNTLRFFQKKAENNGEV